MSGQPGALENVKYMTANMETMGGQQQQQSKSNIKEVVKTAAQVNARKHYITAS